jgi:hypothetical protein
LVLKCAEIAGKSSMKIRILIGAAESIKVTMVEKCGGAVEKEVKINLVANSRNTNAKKTTMRMKMKMIGKRIKPNSLSILDVSVAKNSDIPLIIAPVILI